MAEFYTGQGLAGARTDLGHHVGRWWEVYGVGDMSLYVALRACATFAVSKPGRYNLYNKEWAFDAQIGDVGNDYKRNPGDPTPRGKPSRVQTIEVDPVSYGKAAEWDEDEATVRELFDQGGLALVEEVFLQASLNMMAQGLDYDLKTQLDAATLTASDVSATSAQWSDLSSGTPVAHLSTAQSRLPVEANSAIIPKAAADYHKGSADMTTLFGGTTGVGRLTNGQLASGLSSFGIENVYIGDDTIWGDDVYLFVQRGGDPMVNLNALIRATIRKAGADERGIIVRTKDNDHDMHEVYAQTTCDYGFDPDFVARITDVL